MSTPSTSRTFLLALVAGALTSFGAQAQNKPTTGPALAGAVDFGQATSLPGQPVAMLTTAKATNLSAAPAPEASTAFYDNSHKDLQQALTWMVETNATAPRYWNVYTEARIRLQMKDYAGARTAAEQAQKLALAATPPNEEYARLSAAVATKAQEQLK